LREACKAADEALLVHWRKEHADLAEKVDSCTARLGVEFPTPSRWQSYRWQRRVFSTPMRQRNNPLVDCYSEAVGRVNWEGL
jgi:hypothetical protein